MLKYIFETLLKATNKSLSLLGIVSVLILFLVQLSVYAIVKRTTGVDLWGGNNIPLITILILFISFLIVFVIYFLWELQSVFVRLKFTTKVEWDKQNDQIKKAHLIIDNQEPAELTDCTLSLIDASRLYPSSEDELIELNLIDRGALKWQSSNNNSDCKIELPPAPESRTEICIATFQGRLRFNYCSGAHRDSGTGVFLVKLRLDGKLRGKSIRP